eukprot:1150425-Pelagomonas_calceolata.AAC.1
MQWSVKNGHNAPGTPHILPLACEFAQGSSESFSKMLDIRIHYRTHASLQIKGLKKIPQSMISTVSQRRANHIPGAPHARPHLQSMAARRGRLQPPSATLEGGVVQQQHRPACVCVCVSVRVAVARGMCTTYCVRAFVKQCIQGHACVNICMPVRANMDVAMLPSFQTGLSLGA